MAIKFTQPQKDEELLQKNPSRYFKAAEAAASSNKLPWSDPSICCLIWARCGGQKCPLFIFTSSGRVCAETK